MQNDDFKIEAGKEYLLRNGSRMRCVTVTGGYKGEIRGEIRQPCGDWEGSTWHVFGAWAHGMLCESGKDIVASAPETVDVDCWLSVFANGRYEVTDCELSYAKRLGGFAPIAQIHIKRAIPVGEGM
jgi:hypothetical protein